MKYSTILMTLFIFVACTEKKEPEITPNMHIQDISKLLGEEDQKTTKFIKREAYMDSVKSDMSFVTQYIEICFSFSKKYDKNSIKEQDLKTLRDTQLKMDDLYDRYVSERSETNPMLVIKKGEDNKIENDWVALISFTHTSCMNFGRYKLPKSKDNIFSFDKKYMEYQLYKPSLKVISKFREKHRI